MKRGTIVNHIESIKRNIKSIQDSQSAVELETDFERLKESIRYFDHGERDRFFTPSWVFSLNVDAFEEKYTQNQYKTAFKTVKRAIFTLANRYLKGLQKGLIEYDNE